MFRKLLALFSVLAMASCTPSYADAVGQEFTLQNCSTAKVMARQMLIDFQNGASQFDVMRDLNARPIKDFGPNGENVKLYLQVNVSAFHKNVSKAYRINQILNVLEKDCLDQVGTKL